MYALLPILICAILPTLLLRNFWANDCTKNATQWAKAWLDGTNRPCSSPCSRPRISPRSRLSALLTLAIALEPS